MVYAASMRYVRLYMTVCVYIIYCPVDDYMHINILLFPLYVTSISYCLCIYTIVDFIQIYYLVCICIYTRIIVCVVV